VAHGFAFFTSIVVFCFTAALARSGPEETILVPIFLMALLLASLIVFRLILSAAFRSIQLAAVLEQVKGRGRAVISGVYPDTLRADAIETERPRSTAPLAESTEVHWSGNAAVLQAIDVPELLRVTAAADVVFECCVPIGDTVFPGDLIARIYPRRTNNDIVSRNAVDALEVGPERTFEQDPRLVFRVLSDIALRALSPAINDPTTAAQTLQASESLLRDVVGRDLNIGEIQDPAGTVRVRLTMPAWSEYVGLATEELILAGSSSVQVRRGLHQMLVHLLALAPLERREPLRQALASLEAVSA
jgi:uncharacterized membrane protein